MKQQAHSVLDALGVHLPATGDLTVRSPIDGSVLAQLPTASTADMQAAVGRAHEAFKAWRRATISRLIEVAPADPSLGLGRPLPRDIVDPGYTASPEQDDARISAYLASLDWRNNPYLGKPDEIAGLIIYLCSEEAAFVTGANISINGGQHMY